MKISLDQAISMLRKGEVVALPTDTVFGFGSMHQNNRSIHKIFELKRRPTHNPLVLCLSKKEDLYQFIEKAPPGTDLLIDKFWPGPLTLVLPAKNYTLPTIAIRIPNHRDVLAIIDALGPIFLTSVNLSGEPPLLTPSAIEEVFGADFPILHNNVSESRNLVSTIITYKEGDWVVIRDGCLSEADIKSQLASVC